MSTRGMDFAATSPTNGQHDELLARLDREKRESHCVSFEYAQQLVSAIREQAAQLETERTAREEVELRLHTNRVGSNELGKRLVAAEAALESAAENAQLSWDAARVYEAKLAAVEAEAQIVSEGLNNWITIWRGRAEDANVRLATVETETTDCMKSILALKLAAAQVRGNESAMPNSAVLAEPAPAALNYKPIPGRWTLIDPNGRYFGGDSPLQCVHRESEERIPAEVRLARIKAACVPTSEDLAERETLRIEGMEIAAEYAESWGSDGKFVAGYIRAEIERRKRNDSSAL